MTSVGINVKIASPAAADPAATAVPQPGGEGDVFAQLMAVVGTPAEAIAASPAGALPAAALLAGLAAVREVVPDEAAAAADEPAPDQAQQAGCLIEIADLAAKMLVAVRQPGPRGEEPETGAPKEEESEGDTPLAGQEGTLKQADIGQPIILIPVAAPVAPQAAAPIQPAAEQTPAAPAVQTAAAAALPKGVATEQPVSKKEETPDHAEPAAHAEEKPASVLPAPLRLAIQNLIAEKAPAFARPDAPTASAAMPANDQPAAAPLPASPPTASSVIALMQTQLAAATAPAPAIDRAAAAAAASPEVEIERQLDIARDSEWLDSLARDIARTAGRDATLRFQLHPQSLGTLHVEVAQSHAGTSVRLTADSEAARSIIADAQPRLIAEARAQGVRIAEAHVGMELGSHHASDQRRQSDDRQETILRTAAGETETHIEETTRTAERSAERFA